MAVPSLTQPLPRRAHRPGNVFRPRLEQLEDRTTPSGLVTGAAHHHFLTHHHGHHAGAFTPTLTTPPGTVTVTPGATLADPALITLNLNPLDIKLLGLEVQTSRIQVNVSAQPGQGELLGNLLTDATSLLNIQTVNNALDNVLGGVVSLVNSASLSVGGAGTGGKLGHAPRHTAADTPVLSLFVAPVHLNLLGALVDTSPIQLTITAHSGPGLLLGNVVADLAHLFDPPLPARLDLNFVNQQLRKLLHELALDVPGIPASPVSSSSSVGTGDRILSLSLAPINLNLLGLVLKTSQIQVNADAHKGRGDLLGNVLTDLLNTVGATPSTLRQLNDNLNGLLGKVIGILNATDLLLSPTALGSLTGVLQTLAMPNLINASGTASAPILNLAIASTNGSTPPVDVNLLGLEVTTSNITAQLLAQTGNGQILGNLLYNVANLLNPGGAVGLLTLLSELGA